MYAFMTTLTLGTLIALYIAYPSSAGTQEDLMNLTKANKATLIAAIVIAAFAAVPAFAATNASLSLSGTVAPVLSISVVPEAFASALPVGSAVTAQKIATVTELSNNLVGYTVTLSTANNAELVGALGGNTDTVAYTLIYGGSAVAFTLGTATISDVSVRTSGAGAAKDLAISFGAAFLNADSYSDTLTFTITAK